MNLDSWIASLACKFTHNIVQDCYFFWNWYVIAKNIWKLKDFWAYHSDWCAFCYYGSDMRYIDRHVQLLYYYLSFLLKWNNLLRA